MIIKKLEAFLKKQNVSPSDRRKIVNGFRAISFRRRLLLFAVLKKHPESLPTFIDLINEKMHNIMNPSEEKMDLIVKEEERILQDMFKNFKI